MTLAFVHGFMGGSAQWELQAPLVEACNGVLLDLPGFGANAGLPPINRIEDFAAWALDDLSARGISEFDLLGHSMGGMIAQEMVHQAPNRVRRLILYATGARGALPGRFEPIETSMRRAREDGAKATARRISATWFLEREQATHYPACARVAEAASQEAIQAGLAAMQAWSGEDRLADIAAQTLILWGDQDRTYSWAQIEQLWQRIPNSQLAVVPSCAHAVHAEREGLFNQLVQGFLGSLTAGGEIGG
ncbi:MAG: alpha/beta fold hydrolase [Arenibacterium sp.]